MWLTRVFVFFFVLMLAGLDSARAQQAPAAADPSPGTTGQLLELLKAQDARLKELEAHVAKLMAARPASPGATPTAAPTATAGYQASSMALILLETSKARTSLSVQDIVHSPSGSSASRSA